MPKNEVKSLVKLCASSIAKTIQTSKFASDLSAFPDPLAAHFMISLIGLGIICLQKTIEYGLYGKFASEQSSTERERNTIHIDSEWISDPFHKLVECFVKLGSSYIKQTIENRKFDLSAFNLIKDNAINLSFNSVHKKFEPFRHLPHNLLEEIVECFTRSKKPVNIIMLDHLITSQRQRLSFSVYSDTYLSLFPKLENLLELNFDNTEIGYDCLKSIGIYCPKLRLLNLEKCANVTDYGIQRLFGGAEYPELGNGKAKLCRTLQKLNISSTSVTQRGIQMALKYLLCLQIIEHEYTFETLVVLAQSVVNSRRGRCNMDKLSLSTLCSLCDKPYVNGSLQLALSMCDSITLIYIYTTKGFIDNDLLCLMSIKTLRGLKIFSSPKYNYNIGITVKGGLLPLLKVIGKSLKNLSFYCFDYVRISEIAKFCPNLTELHISNNRNWLEDEGNFFKMEKKLPIFRQLTFLSCHYSFPSHILHFLLSSPLLQDICFSYCKTLTKEVLQKAANYHGFKKLEKLDLQGCNAVSERQINALLAKHNHLKEICVTIF